MDGAFVEFRHVHAAYKPAKGIGALLGKASTPIVALQDVSFSLHKGEHIAVFGPAGSGKSTLLALLSGSIAPDSGTVTMNGANIQASPTLLHGYVSLRYGDMKGSTVHEALHAFGVLHNIPNLPARIGEIIELMNMQDITDRNVDTLSLGERLRVKIARAALSDAPIILLDDVADILGVVEMRAILHTLFTGRTVCMTTRSVHVAEALDVPILLLHKSSLVHAGKKEEIAHASGVERVIHAWIEGMRYDMLRKLRSHPGVLEVRLVPTDRFEGTCVRITIQNSRYLPALYSALSEAPLISIEELPVPLSDILDSLS